MSGKISSRIIFRKFAAPPAVGMGAPGAGLFERQVALAVGVW